MAEFKIVIHLTGPEHESLLERVRALNTTLIAESGEVSCLNCSWFGTTSSKRCPQCDGDKLSTYVAKLWSLKSLLRDALMNDGLGDLGIKVELSIAISSSLRLA
jgi:uncharacterized paraquat-inducible protein A